MFVLLMEKENTSTFCIGQGKRQTGFTEMMMMWKKYRKVKRKTQSAMDPFQILFWQPKINCAPAVERTQLFVP